jgi:hypothetical protein
MRLELSLSFDTQGTGLLIKSNRGESMSEPNEFRDFSGYLGDQLKRKADEERQKNQKTIQDREILERGFSALWDGLHKAMEGLCETISKDDRVGVRLLYSPNSAGCIVSRTDAPAKLQLKAEPNDRSFIFRVVDGNQYEATYKPRLSNTDVDFCFADKTGMPITVQKMCMRAMAAFLAVPFSGD